MENNGCNDLALEAMVAVKGRALFPASHLVPVREPSVHVSISVVMNLFFIYFSTNGNALLKPKLKSQILNEKMSLPNVHYMVVIVKISTRPYGES